MYQLVLRFARRLAAKPDKTGIMQVPTKQEAMDAANEILTKFKKHGVPNEALKTENDVKIIFNQIQEIENQQLRKNVISPGNPRYKEITEKIFGKKSGDVVDLTGTKIDTSKPILGGKNVPETDVEILERLNKGNKESIPRFKEKMSKEVVTVDSVIIDIKKLEPIESMKETNKVLRGEGRYKSLSKAEREKIAGDESVTDHIFERNIDETEDFAQGGRSGSGLNYLLGEDDQNTRVPYSKGSRKKSWTDRIAGWTGGTNVMAGEIGLETWDLLNNLLQSGGLYAEGGRTGFGIGGMGRRAFLKMMGAGAATAGAAKTGLFGLLKAGKPAVVETLTSVPIKSGVDGMPAWFKPLVNKVIKEGDDVTKRFATQERQIVHQSALPDSKTPVIVTQNLDTGHVSVDVGMGKHGFKEGHLGQPVRLEYRASELIEPPIIKEGKVAGHGKGTKTKEEFNVEEAEFSGGHPENIKFEESTFEKFGEHGSNFDEVEKFATGKIKKKTAEESIKAQRAHWTPEGDMASGGRVPYFTGNIVDPEGYNISKREMGILANVSDPETRKMLRDFLTRTKHHKPIYPDRILEINRGRRTGEASGGRVPLAGGLIVKGGNWLLKTLRGTREAIKKNKTYPPEQIKSWVSQIDAQIKNIEGGGKIPDEVIQVIRSDPKFKSVWQNQLSPDPDLREMEEVLLEYGTKHAEGGRVPLSGGDWVKKRFHEYTKEGRDEFKKEWLDRKDLGMTVEEWNALPLKEKIKIRLREGNASGGVAGMLGE